jgi:hypothetical protein
LKLSLNKNQWEFLNAREKFVLFAGGRGSGKTFAGAAWTLNKLVSSPDAIGLIGANNPDQLHKVTLPALTALLKDAGIDYVYGKAPPWFQSRTESNVGVLSVSNGAQVYCLSLFEYDRNLRGKQFGWMWIDESRDLKPEAFMTAIACLRGYDRPGIPYPYQCRLTSTPAGFDWQYKKFLGDERLPNSRLVRGRTSDNARWLPQDYENDLKSIYGATLASQELMGEFVNTTAGKVFEFDRLRHVREQQYDAKSQVLCFGLDFNVSPLAGNVGFYDKASKSIHWGDEIHVPRGTTRDACDEFVRRWRGKAQEVWFLGDQAGNAEHTSSSETDVQIMQRIVRAAGFPKVRDLNDRRKPRVADRVNATNALLNPSVGKTRMTVSKDCPYLVRDLEELAWTPGTKKIDKDTNPDLSHHADAATYVVEKVFPLTQTVGMAG